MTSTNDGFEDTAVERWGRYAGEPSPEQLIRFFTLTLTLTLTLTTGDLERVHQARSDPTRLGYAVQLATLRFLSTFLADPAGTPPGVIGHLADQLDIDPHAWGE